MVLKMTFLWSKKYANFSAIVKWHFYHGIFDPNHGLTPLEICPIFNYSFKNDIFIVQKASYWENNIMKRQHQDLLYRKQRSRDIWNF